MFVIGFSSAAKDSYRNLVDTGEGVINMISDTYIEAANSTSVDAPFGVSEWDVCGLTPVRDCEVVKPARVREAVFSVEVRVESVREWESRVSGEKTGVMVVLEGVWFWAREDGINEERNLIDPAVGLFLSLSCLPLFFTKKRKKEKIHLHAVTSADNSV